MSGAIWGNPLVSGFQINKDDPTDPSVLSNLNNWSKQDMADNLDIKYDSSSRTNIYSYNMVAGKFEGLYYEFPVERNTWYTFRMILNGSFEERNRTGTHMWVAVCNSLPEAKYFEDQFDVAIEKSRIVPNEPNIVLLHFYSGDMDSVYFWIDMAACTDAQKASFNIRRIECGTHDHAYTSMFWLQHPMSVNGYFGEDEYDDAYTFNIVAVSGGAWACSLTDSTYTHHIYMLSGNEFKVLTVYVSESGFVSSSEVHSSPITIKGRTYHICHLSWGNIGPGTDGYVDIWETSYFALEDFPSDDDIYFKLSELVRTSAQYVSAYWYLVNEYTKHRLYNELGVESGAISSSEIDEMFKDYTVDSVAFAPKYDY